MNRFYWLIIKCAPKMLPILFKMRHMVKHPDKYTDVEKFNEAMKNPHIVVQKSGIKLLKYGTENVPRHDGVLFCANHQDKFDPLLIWDTCPVRTCAVIADKACHRPVIGEISILTNAIRLEQDNIRAMYRMTEEITERLSNGESFILFPEGDYEEDVYHLSPFMNGSFRSALRSGAPIIPVAIINSFHVIRENRKLPITCEVHYLDPIFKEEYEGMKTKEISELVKSRIQAAVDEFQK